MAGIDGIAREVGVSISTVSYALNGAGKIRGATQRRILNSKGGVAYNWKP